MTTETITGLLGRLPRALAASAGGAVFAGALALAAAVPAFAAGKVANWLVTFETDANGAHSVGNPDADVKLTEYLSYTCSHCANFHKTSEVPLRLQYVRPGRVQVTASTFLRNDVDKAVALLANCGEPDRFWVRHSRFLSSQERWMAPLAMLSPAQRARWEGRDAAANMRNIASDLDLYAVVEPLGIDRAQANRCLSDVAATKRIEAQDAAARALGVTGTPSFALDGERIVGVYDDWPTLDILIQARLGDL